MTSTKIPRAGFVVLFYHKISTKDFSDFMLCENISIGYLNIEYLVTWQQEKYGKLLFSL